jgi:hypothetical protein
MSNNIVNKIEAVNINSKEVGMKKKMVMLAVLCALLGGTAAFAAQESERMSIEDAIAVYAAEYQLDDQAQKELATRLEAVALRDGTVNISVARDVVSDILLGAPVHEVVAGDGQGQEQGDKEEEEFGDVPLMEEVSESEEDEKKEAGAVQPEPVGASLPPVKPSKSKREGKRSPEEKELLLHLHELGRDERLREREEAQAHGILVRPGKEKGPGALAQQKLLEQMAEQVMGFLPQPQPWNIQIPPGQQFVDIGKIAPSRVASAAVSQDGRFVAAVKDASPREILVWDMNTGKIRKFDLEKERGLVLQVGFRAEGKELVALTSTSSLKF